MLHYQILIFALHFLSNTTILSLSLFGTPLKDLTYSTQVFFQSQANDWSGDNDISQCNGKYIVGGYQTLEPNEYFEKQFTGIFSSHDYLLIQFTAYLIDNWDPSDEILVTADGVYYSFKGFDSSNFESSLCGNSGKKDLKVTLLVTIPHTTTQLNLRFTSRLTQPSSNRAFGIRDLEIQPAGDSGDFGTGTCASGVEDFNTMDRCCPYGEYLDGDYECQSCAAGCKTCTGGGSSSCHLCEDTFYANSGQCQGCNSDCDTCSGGGASDCLSCPSLDEYVAADGSCQQCHSSCRTCDGGSDTDCLSCDSGDFWYWNGKCLPDCDTPLSVEPNPQGNDQCVYPCTGSDWLYWEGSCVADCDDELIQNYIEGEQICEFPCDLNTEYYNTDTSCSALCLPPNGIRNGVGGAQYCDEPCPNPLHYLYENGTCDEDCIAPYESSILSGVNRCNKPCSLVEFYMDFNTSCVDHCEAPYREGSESGIQTCERPCENSDTEYYYSHNDSCIEQTECSEPYQEFTGNGYPECAEPCEEDEYYFIHNSTCSTTCPIPYTISYQDSVTICNLPCDQGLFYSPSTSQCVSACESPYLQSSDVGYDQCLLPCPTQQHYLYTHNSTCSNTTCVFPYKLSTENGFNLCAMPSCVTSSNFLYIDYTCASECPSPYNQTTTASNSSVQYCRSPCSDSTPIYNKETSKCVEKCPENTQEIEENKLRICEKKLIEITEEAKAISEYGSTAVSTAVAGSVIVGATGVASSSAFGMVILSKFLYYIRYMDVDYPDNLQSYLEFSNSSSSIPGFSFPQNLRDDFHSGYVDQKFSYYGIQSSFLINYWGSAMNIVVCIGLTVVIKIFQIIFKRCQGKDIKVILKGLELIFASSLPLLLFCSAIDEVVLYSAIDYISFNGSLASSYISLMISLVSIGLSVFLLAKIIKVTKAYQKLTKASILPQNVSLTKELKLFKKKWKHYQVLYASFKDSSFLKQSFLAFFLIRVIIYNIIIIALQHHPKAQVVLVLLLSLAMLAYLIGKRPCKSRWNNLELILYELTIFTLNVMLSILVFDESSRDSGFRSGLGSGIITCFTIFYSLQMFFLVQSIVGTILQARQEFKQSKGKGKATCMILITMPFKSGGMELMDLEEEDDDEVGQGKKKKGKREAAKACSDGNGSTPEKGSKMTVTKNEVPDGEESKYQPNGIEMWTPIDSPHNAHTKFLFNQSNSNSQGNLLRNSRHNNFDSLYQKGDSIDFVSPRERDARQMLTPLGSEDRGLNVSDDGIERTRGAKSFRGDTKESEFEEIHHQRKYRSFQNIESEGTSPVDLLDSEPQKTKCASDLSKSHTRMTSYEPLTVSNFAAPNKNNNRQTAKDNIILESSKDQEDSIRNIKALEWGDDSFMSSKIIIADMPKDIRPQSRAYSKKMSAFNPNQPDSFGEIGYNKKTQTRQSSIIQIEQVGENSPKSGDGTLNQLNFKGIDWSFMNSKLVIADRGIEGGEGGTQSKPQSRDCTPKSSKFKKKAVQWTGSDLTSPQNQVKFDLNLDKENESHIDLNVADNDQLNHRKLKLQPSEDTIYRMSSEYTENGDGRLTKNSEYGDHKLNSMDWSFSSDPFMSSKIIAAEMPRQLRPQSKAHTTKHSQFSKFATGENFSDFYQKNEEKKAQTHRKIENDDEEDNKNELEIVNMDN